MCISDYYFMIIGLFFFILEKVNLRYAKSLFQGANLVIFFLNAQ